MDKHQVVIVDYDPRWAILFREEREQILHALNEPEAAVEHFGSTAVPGLAAKPIVDIAVSIPELHERYVHSLAQLGYECLGEVRVRGRWFFVKEAPHAFHLHLYRRGHEELARVLRFRDYVRAHPQVAQEYVRLKRELAERYADAIDLYRFYKSEFIEGVDALAAGE